MCKAIQDIRKDAIAEGKAEGRAEGKAEGRAEGEAIGMAKLKQALANLIASGMEESQARKILGLQKISRQPLNFSQNQKLNLIFETNFQIPNDIPKSSASQTIALYMYKQCPETASRNQTIPLLIVCD